MAAASELVQSAPQFQRAVHLRYDLRNSDVVDRYIPTQSAASALNYILKGAEATSTQRAHVLYAAYGSGKSLFAVSTASLLENRGTARHTNLSVVQRIGQIDPEAEKRAEHWLASGQRMLPVVLSGNEGDFGNGLTRALTRALDDAGLDIRIPSAYAAALDTISYWEESFPGALVSFENILWQEAQLTLADLTEQLSRHQSSAFELFESLFPRVSAGAHFNAAFERNPELIFREAATEIRGMGYAGIVVLWDEFGRYLEASAANAFGTEAAILQNFAETCNYSGESQIHLLLFTHKELQGYASALPKTYQQEWSRIEGRFQRHNISSDPDVAYRLISNALQYTDHAQVKSILDSMGAHQISREAWQFELFPGFEIGDTMKLAYSTYPLHPSTTFALVHLSSRVAQNERTMFTFLSTDEEGALRTTIEGIDGTSWVRVDHLWDYFSDAVRSDTGVGGAHRIWSGVEHALDKVLPDDALARAVIKALGVLLTCASQSQVRPTTELLTWVLANEEVPVVLDHLRRRKAVIQRKIDGYWTFTSGSDFDFEETLHDILKRNNPSDIQLRRILENVVPAPTTLARRYNQERAMTRFVKGIYRWPGELEDLPWDALVDQLESDGAVVYLLGTDGIELDTKALPNHLPSQIVLALPKQPLIHLKEILREIYALYEMRNDLTLKQHDDHTRVQRELDWLIEDAESRLEKEVTKLIDPRQGQSLWALSRSQEIHVHAVASTSHTTRLVSELCERTFPATPVFNSEGANKRTPTTQQMRASELVVDALYNNELDSTLGLKGNGPELLALNAFLVLPGILQQDAQGQWVIDRPLHNPVLANVWDEIEAFFIRCQSDGSQSVRDIVQVLMSAPYGIRWGALPILLAAVLRKYLRVTTIRSKRRSIFPISGELFTSMLKHPDDFSIEVGEWSQAQESMWRAVLAAFAAQMHPSERTYQPIALFPVLLLRWLQTQNAFCRQTKQLSHRALRFRDLIRLAQTEPARVLFQELPQLMDECGSFTRSQIETSLCALSNEISGAYLDLQQRLDVYATDEFFPGASSGYQAMRMWIERIENFRERGLEGLQFGTVIAQELLYTILHYDPSQGLYWDLVAQVVTGLHLRDWTDQTEVRFYETLTKARLNVEHEIQDLRQEEAVVSVQLQLRDQFARDYRFRYADLSVQGQRILQNLKSTLEIAGRPLSADERRQIAVAFLTHVMGDDLAG
jgi:hypothetical protein